MQETPTVTVMPDGQTTTTENETKKQTQVIDKGPYILEENIFGGKLDKLGYYVLQFKSGTDAEADESVRCILTGNPAVIGPDGSVTIPESKPKWSSKQLIALVNSAVRASQRVKAQQEILSIEEEKREATRVKRLNENSCLLSPEDAEKWVPGERDLSIQGMMRKVAELQKEGKVQEAFAMLMEVQKQMSEQLQVDVVVAQG